MDQGTREHLRIILSVALALVPKRIRKDWVERVTAMTQPATAEIVGGLAAAVADLVTNAKISIPHDIWR
jgi:hypothetical protein